MKDRLSVTTFMAALVVVVSCGLSGCFEAEQDVPDDLASAQHAMMTRDYLEAEKEFERYLRRNPNGTERWVVWNNLVELALSVRNDRKAGIEILEAMLIEYAEVPDRKRDISGRLADLYRLARKYDRALTLWSSVAEDSNAAPVDRANACRNLANVYLRRLELELAKESLGYCLALDIPDTVRAECLYDLAQTYVGIGDLDQAQSYFQAVLALDDIPESRRALTVFMLADALEQKGDKAGALRLFTSIEATYPNPQVVAQRIAFLQNKRKPPAPARRSNGK